MIAALISTYGYIAIFIGTVLEGETVLVIGGIAAHGGFLSLWWVIFWGFLGSAIGDNLFFFWGRYHGKAFLQKPSRRKLKKRVDYITKVLHKHQDILMMGFRFLYGLRTVTPFAIGMSEIKTSKFIIYNILGAAVWTLIFALGGFAFGNALIGRIEHIRNIELTLIKIVAVGGVSIWALFMIRKVLIFFLQPDEE